MARQRWIHPDFWTDPSVAKLSPVERLFFIGCFSNADDEGRLLGDPAYLRSIIFPYDDIPVAKVQAMRDRVVQTCTNLVLYRVDDVDYLAFLKWTTYQSPRYPKPSKLPPPPGMDDARETQGCNQIDASLPQDGDDTDEAMREHGNPGFGLGLGCSTGLGKGRGDEPQPSDASPRERETLNILRGVKGYPFDYRTDLEHIRKLAVDFPDVDILVQARKWATYKLDKPLKRKSNPRLQFRNWCENADCYAKERAAKVPPPRTGPSAEEQTRQAQAFISHLRAAGEAAATGDPSARASPRITVVHGSAVDRTGGDAP
jgi:hypothetical protein